MLKGIVLCQPAMVTVMASLGLYCLHPQALFQLILAATLHACVAAHVVFSHLTSVHVPVLLPIFQICAAVHACPDSRA